jgi:hypothetical protein
MAVTMFFSGPTTVRKWEIAIPVLGIIVLGYTLFRTPVVSTAKEL